MTAGSTSEIDWKRLKDFHDHAFIGIDIIIFGKKHTIKNFPWCMG